MRKPRAITLRDGVMSFTVRAVDSVYRAPALRMCGVRLTLGPARRLHKWLADAIQWMEEKVKGEG